MISLKNKNIFIAGGSGYLGSVLCEEILKLEGNIFLADQDIKRSELVICLLYTSPSPRDS